MNTILTPDLFTSNEVLNVILLCLAAFRVWLEIIGFDFQHLPMTRALSKKNSEVGMNNFHRMGLVFSIGYILFFAPAVLI